MARARKPRAGESVARAEDDSEGETGGKTKTTLYLDRRLHQAAKAAAKTAGLSLNALLLEAIEERLDRHHSPMTSSSGEDIQDIGGNSGRTIDPDDDLRGRLQQLSDRMATVEAAVGRPGVLRASPNTTIKRPLTVTQVRKIVREILLAHDEPIPHRALLHILVDERGLILPGRDVSENLRTILVHPKAQGFIFERGRGYSVKDGNVPPA